MNIKELKEELEKFDENLPVMVYTDCGEDGGMAKGIELQNQDDKENLLYFKGDHPFSYNKDKNGNKILKAVCIIGD